MRITPFDPAFRQTAQTIGKRGTAAAARPAGCAPPTQVAAEPVDDWYYQQFIPGESCSAAYLAAGRRALLLGVTRQLIGTRWLHSHGFRYAGSIGPWPVSPAVHRQFIEIGTALATDFDLAGLFGVDAVLADDVVWPVEVNPRYSASLEVLERSRGTSFVGLHIEACRDGVMPAARHVQRGSSSDHTAPVCGRAILFAPRDCVVPPALSEAWLKAGVPDDRAHDLPAPVNEIPNAFDWPEFGDVPAGGTRIAAGDPIITLLASAQSVDAVERKLQIRAAAAWDALISPAVADEH